MNELKTIRELVDGDCTVVTKHHGTFNGSYCEKYKCVFFVIPSHYEIIGYYQ